MKAVLLPLFVFFLAIGCTKKEQGASQNTVKINLVSNPQTLDPRLARDPNSQTVMRMLFEGLTRVGRDDQTELALARGVEISEDLKTYIFTLRDANWTNGDPVLASDFLHAWKTILSPDFACDNAYQLYVLKNAKKVKEGRLPSDQLGVLAVNERTLLVELEYPTPYILELLAAPFFYPVHQGLDEENPHWSLHASDFVSNGPFRLKDYRLSDQIYVAKNPDYWDADSVHLNGIELFMLEGETEMKLYEKGGLHWAGSPLSTIPVDAIQTLKKEKKLHVKPRAETAFLRVNTSNPALTNPKLRKALALAIDRESIVEHVAQGGLLGATGLLPPSLKLTDKPYFEDAAAEKAAALFDETLETGALPELTLLYIHSERTHLIAQAIQQQWREALGILIHLEGIERKVYFDRISRKNYDLAFCSWGADFHDPINFLEVFKYKTQSTNNTEWEDPEYAKALTTSFSLINPVERRALLRSAEERLMEAMPIIPLYTYTMLYLHDEKLKGVFLSALGNLDFKWASLENVD